MAQLVTPRMKSQEVDDNQIQICPLLIYTSQGNVYEITRSAHCSKAQCSVEKLSLKCEPSDLALAFEFLESIRALSWTASFGPTPRSIGDSAPQACCAPAGKSLLWRWTQSRLSAPQVLCNSTPSISRIRTAICARFAASATRA